MIIDRAAVCRHKPALMAPFLAWVALSGPALAAVPVDAELVLVVDVTRRVSDAEFGVMMGSLALGFQSSGVLDAIQSGTTGTLAASLVFYTNRNRQAVGVDWMAISDADSAAAFALALASVSRPFGEARTSIANAMNFTVPRFGSETGSPGNGYESAVQAMFFVGGGADDSSARTNGSRELTVANARDAAFQSGVDIISALAVGAPGTVDDYFRRSVTGGAVGTIQGGVSNAADIAQALPMMAPALEEAISAMVPEPGWPALAAGSIVLLLGRRRRRILSC